MNSDSLAHLASKTPITYLAEGSIARAMVEATNLEISRLQEYIATIHSNVFIATATGFYLDLIGEQLGLPRLNSIFATSSAEDQNVEFFTNNKEKLGNYFPNPANLNQGLIPVNTKITTSDSSIIFKVSSNVYFDKNINSVFVPVIAEKFGTEYNVGKFKLNTHTGPSNVSVTNHKSISNGSITEPDSEYRFRLSNAFVAAPSSNETSIKLIALSNPEISNIQLIEFARGAGTFDALIVPVGNTVTNRSKKLVEAAINNVKAFGISSRITEPTYIKFKISILLIENDSTSAGSKDIAKINAKRAILQYFDSIPMGGELIINQLKAAILNATGNLIKDISINELCVNKKPFAIRNYKLRPDELFTPDNNRTEDPITII